MVSEPRSPYIEISTGGELEAILTALRAGAESNGIGLWPGIPERLSPVVQWTASWEQFIDLAVRAQATILYMHEFRYQPEWVLSTLMTRAGYPPDEEDEEQIEGGPTWFRQRLIDLMQPWQRHAGELAHVEVLWRKDGIGHLLELGCPWYEELLTRVGDDVNQAEDEDRERDAALRTDEALRLHRMAGDMARHERFPEANSAEKRRFMAEQIFPQEARWDRIADRASLIYWWEVEPQQRITLIERAQEMFQQGESVRNIAAILKITEERARRLIGDLLPPRSRRP